MEDPALQANTVSNLSPNPPGAPAAPKSLQALIYQGVSDALLQAGVTPATISPDQEAVVVGKARFMTVEEAEEHPLPLINPSKWSRNVNLGPHLRVHYRKGISDGYETNWPGHRGKGQERLYGHDQVDLRERFREQIIEFISSKGKKNAISESDRIAIQLINEELKEAELESVNLLKLARPAIVLFKAIKNLKLKSEATKLAQYGVEEGERELLTVGESVALRLGRIKAADPDSLGGENGANDRAILNRLEAEYGPDFPVLHMLKDTGRLRAVINREIHLSKDAPMTKGKNFDALVTYFAQLQTVHRLPLLDKSIMGKRPKKGKPPVVVPKAVIVSKFLYLVVTKCPEILLFVLFQYLAGLRPQEAYRGIQDPRAYIKGKWIYVPAGANGIAKRQCRVNRWIRRRPLFDVLLPFVPGWGDPLASFVPEVDGEMLTWSEMQTIIRDLLHEAGWSGPMPRECGRKCFISACVACFGLDKYKLLKFIVREAGHVTEKTIEDWYDGNWDIEDGFAYFGMFLSFIQNPPTENLHQCFGQKLKEPKGTTSSDNRNGGRGRPRPRRKLQPIVEQSHDQMSVK